MPKFPNAYLQLTGEDGHLGAIMGRGTALLKEIDQPPEVIQEWRLSLFSGSYEDALRTCMEWFVCG